MLLLYIAVGGALGAVARYALGGWVHGWAGAGFPWGTFLINITGSLVLGFAVRFLEGVAAPPELRGFIAIGVLGGYTTFSTFSYEAAALIQGGDWSRAGLYVAGSVALSLAGVVAGFALAALALRTGG